MPTRLEIHRDEFHSGKCLGKLLKIEELTVDELTMVNSSIFLYMGISDAQNLDGYYQVYIETLHSWGIMCPHPQIRRLYDGYRKSDYPIQFNESKWYSCTLCKTSVINR